MVTDKKVKLQNIKNEVACPLKAMSIEGSELVCACPSVLYKSIGKVSLGSVKDDILDNCGTCKEKLDSMKDLGDPKEYAKILEIDDCHEIECPAEGGSKVSAMESCRGCTFFKKDMFKEQMEKAGADAEMKEIPCGYPVLDKQQMKVFLARKARKKASKEVLPEQAATSD